MPPSSAPVTLPYNLNVFSSRAAGQDGDFDDGKRAIPSEMIGDTVSSEGIQFTIGPRGAGKLNAVKCQGQTISLPEGSFNRLYLLAAAANGDTDGTFSIGGQDTSLHIEDWSGYIGSWDNRVFQGDVPAVDVLGQQFA